MNRSFTKEYWLLLGIWAGATLLKGMSIFIDVRMPFYPWFRFSVVFGAVAFALFLLIVIRSGLRPCLLAVGLHLLLNVLVELLPWLLLNGSLTGIGRYLLNALLLYLIPVVLYLVLSKLLLWFLRGREWAVFHLLVLLRLLAGIGWVMWQSRMTLYTRWDLALGAGIPVAAFWLYTLFRRRRASGPASGSSTPAVWAAEDTKP